MDEILDNTGHGRKVWMSAERVLLITILLLQFVILAWLWKEHNLKDAARRMTAEAPVISIPGKGTEMQGRAFAGYPSSGRDRRIASAIEQMQEAKRMFAQMDSMFESMVHDSALIGPFVNIDDGWDALVTSPAMDMKEREKEYVVVFSLPGVKLSDVTVTLDGRLLTVATAVSIGRQGNVATFQRSIRIPGPVGEAQLASAAITNGILRVTIPKGTGSESKAVRQKLL